MATLMSEDDEVLDHPVLSWEVQPTFWERQAREQLYFASRLFPHLVQRRAKSAILFLGKGLTSGGLSSGRLYKAFKAKRTGEVKRMSFEVWPFSTMCRTYDLETMSADEASSATALLTGTKTRSGVLGLTGDVKRGSCHPYTKHEKTMSILNAAVEAGLATGIVTNTRLTQAPSAANFGYATSQGSENDIEVNRQCDETTDLNSMDLAKQLVLEHPMINVLLGGGQENFYPNTSSLPSDATRRGLRGDGLFLTDIWLSTLRDMGRSAEYAGKISELHEKVLTRPDYLLGLLAPSHLPAEIGRKPTEPGLANLTKVALEVLMNQGKGYFLFVEGGPTDKSYVSDNSRILEEILAFDDAVKAAVDMVNLRETLIIVVAFPSQRIEDYHEFNRFRKNLHFLDKTAGSERSRLNFSQDDGRGGEDTGVYAIGPLSHLFHRTIDDTFIAHAMKFALCLPPHHRDNTRCRMVRGEMGTYKENKAFNDLMKYFLTLTKSFLN
ncbi:Alkaline phosphatase, tissue-nonspecific isozyme [Echinococcus granulosus]|uniref:alkaline phosphatase n=1 Tax=Echinococcus granulosus TaxID=6210 RepID=A0A068WBS1_ECHGR|nr:Alkaline phosphatase, tissue-nonspecific isozyme [Echinococcus granulosus]CDS15126.1 alkaline phosphatase intestinal gene 2 [Echinococcus granulosus]